MEENLFANLLHGRTAQGEPLFLPHVDQVDRSLGWRLSLAADPNSNTLWALAPAPLRAQIGQAHSQAVSRAVCDFEHILNGRPWIRNMDAAGRKSALFARFQSGATRTQTPRLMTTLFLFNLLFEKGVPNRSLGADYVEQARSRLEASYAAEFQRGLHRVLGTPPILPEKLTELLQNHPPSKENRASGLRQPLQGRELFAAWSKQAQVWRWGPERVAQLLQETASKTTVANLVRDARHAGRLWSISIRQ